MDEANEISALLYSNGIRSKILGQTLYYSGISRLFGNQHPLTVWIVKNDQYRAAIKAIWKAQAIEGAERTRSFLGWAVPTWLKVFLWTVFLSFAVIVSGGYFET